MSDLYKSTYDSQIYDLDDLSIYNYKWKKMGLWDFFIECNKEAAWSLYYMDYWSNPDGSDVWASQRIRVTELIDELMKIKYTIDLYRIHSNMTEFDNLFILPLLKWRFKFEDEVENQC
jgi:hypothetical protein